MNILIDASLPGLHDAFPPPFKITLYQHINEVTDSLINQDILLCRSTLKVNEALLASSSLSYVATASSGTDHINTTYLEQRAIGLIDAKGSNAEAVADYILATVAYLKKYKQFKGKTAGIIGMGAVGSRVARYLQAIDMNVVTYDPPKSQQQADFNSCSLPELSLCDMICIHANLHDKAPYPSKNLLGHKELAMLKPNIVIINAARGGIVSEQALLELDNPIIYCTDVFLNEPAINEHIVNFSTLCTPHIAGHSIEAKQVAVTMVSEKLHHCYDLPAPAFKQATLYQDHLKLPIHWEEAILSRYNPMNESLALKKALHKEQGFLELRKKHTKRHNFNVGTALTDGKMAEIK